MPIITKESAKQHCRTCLTKLTDERKAPVEDENDIKSISISVSTNKELRELIEYYIEKNIMNDMEYPQNVCLSCFNKLQAFDKFRKQALESFDALKSLFVEGGVTKTELEQRTHDVEGNENKNIYNMMLTDALMETESIVLKDHSDTTTLVTVEMQVPDPFSTNDVAKQPVSKIRKTQKKTDKEGQDHCSNSDKICFKKKRKKTATQRKTDQENENYDNYNYNDLILSSTDDEDDCVPLAKMQKSNAEHSKKQIKYPTKQNLRVKPRKKVSKKSYRCDQCNHSFAHKLTRDAHIRKVHEYKKQPYQCEICDKRYTSFYALSTHISVIHEAEERSYTCEYPDCNRCYKSLNALQKHKRDKHLGLFRRKTFICELCGATYSNLRHHKHHKHPLESGETSKENHICSICNKQFYSHYTLKYHVLQVHSNDMKFECNICGKRHAKKFMLVQHMRIHTLDCFPCSQCDKQFKLKNKLNSHVRAVHLKLKPYSCQYCPEIFATRSTVRHHEYIHTGEKPYVCDICGQAYRQQNTLKGHRKSHETPRASLMT